MSDKESAARAEATANSGGGCLWFVLTVVVLWGLAFGFTYRGIHYGVRCTSENGVEVYP